MRRLKPDAVPPGLIRQILEAGTCAPSGGNMQSWRFMVITDPAVKAKTLRNGIGCVAGMRLLARATARRRAGAGFVSGTGSIACWPRRNISPTICRTRQCGSCRSPRRRRTHSRTLEARSHLSGGAEYAAGRARHSVLARRLQHFTFCLKKTQRRPLAFRQMRTAMRSFPSAIRLATSARSPSGAACRMWYSATNGGRWAERLIRSMRVDHSYRALRPAGVDR